MIDLDLIQYTDRMVGANSPDYDDTLNKALLQVITASGADDSAFVGFALRPTVAPTVGQFYIATDTDVGASWQTLTTSMISDIASAATGITKVGTVDTGVWHGTSISTTYTDAKVKTVTGTTNRLTVAGTATDPTFDIALTYVGQTSITTVGTIATGVWNGTSIGTAYTDAKVVSLTGTSNRLTVGGTATVPVLDISASYVGQGSITTVGTITSGTWQGTAVADTYLAALSASKLTGTTLPVGIVTSSLTAVGTIATGVWQGTSISTTYTDAKIASVTGTLNRITIGGTATAPTFDISTSYVGQATITTLGTIGTGTWAATTISVDKGGTGLTSYTIGDTLYASGATTIAKLGIGTAGQFKVVNGGATAPAWHTLVTADVTDLTTATTGITKVGTVTTGIWNAGVIPGTYGGTGVNNGASIITLGGSFTTSGAFTTTLTVTGTTNVTLPTSGTLVNTAVTTLSSLTTAGSLVTVGALNSGSITSGFGAIDIGADAITAGAASFTTGAFSAGVTAARLDIDSPGAVGTGGNRLNFKTADAIAWENTTVIQATVATGITLIRPAASNGTIQIQNSGGTSLLTVDTGTNTSTFLAGAVFGGSVSGITTLATTGQITSGGDIKLTNGNGLLNTANSRFLHYETADGLHIDAPITTNSSLAMGGALSGVTSLVASGAVTLQSTLQVNGAITSALGNNTTIVGASNATTGYIAIFDLINTSGRLTAGVENSSGGGITGGSSAYAGVLGTIAAKPLELGTNNTIRLSISSAGAFDFKSNAVSAITTLATSSDVVFGASSVTNGTGWGRIAQVVSSGSAAFSMRDTSATAQQWSIAVNSKNFEIFDDTASVHALTITKATGAAAFVAGISATAMRTNTASISTTTAVAATLIALGAVTVNGESYFVTVGSSTYTAGGWILVVATGSGWAIVTSNLTAGGGTLVASLSGNNLQITQTSGSNQSFDARAIHVL